MTIAERMTREEKKAATRRRLLQAATVVFARRGFAAATLDEVAEEAGLTKGAVYSNFANKDDLVFAVLDDTFERRLHDITSRVDREASLEDQIRSAGRMMNARNEDEEWLQLLSYELMAYATRNPEFRARYAAGHRDELQVMTETIRQNAEERGITTPLPPEEFAVVLNALVVGLEIEKRQNEDGVPEDLFATVISLLYRGAMSGAEEATA